jgi:hypothetical protein
MSGRPNNDIENDRVERVFARHPDAVGAGVHDIDGETFGLEPLAQPCGQALSSSTTNRRILVP